MTIFCLAVVVPTVVALIGLFMEGIVCSVPESLGCQGWRAVSLRFLLYGFMGWAVLLAVAFVTAAVAARAEIHQGEFYKQFLIKYFGTLGRLRVYFDSWREVSNFVNRALDFLREPGDHDTYGLISVYCKEEGSKLVGYLLGTETVKRPLTFSGQPLGRGAILGVLDTAYLQVTEVSGRSIYVARIGPDDISHLEEIQGLVLPKELLPHRVWPTDMVCRILQGRGAAMQRVVELLESDDPGEALTILRESLGE